MTKQPDDMGLTKAQRRSLTRIQRAGGVVLAAPNNRFNLPDGRTVGRGVIDALRELDLIRDAGDALLPGMTQTLRLTVR